MRSDRTAGRAAFLLGLMVASLPLQAVPPMAPTKPAVTNAPPVPDAFNRYGKIWSPSDDVYHPIKLSLPNLGELKFPTQDELNARDKLEQLATLSDDQILQQLSQWPPFTKMKLGDQGQMLSRIQSFKDQRSHTALDKAKELGLLTLTPEQQARFEKEYWEKQLQLDHELVKQFEPILKAREQKLGDDLFREFSTPGAAVPPPQPPKPAPQVPVAQAKPQPPAPTPVALNKPQPPPAPLPAPTTVPPPVGQAKSGPNTD